MMMMMIMMMMMTMTRMTRMMMMMMMMIIIIIKIMIVIILTYYIYQVDMFNARRQSSETTCFHIVCSRPSLSGPHVETIRLGFCLSLC